MPGAEPFAADGGDVGVVLGHGTGTPQSLPWADPGRVTAPVALFRSRVGHVVDLVRAHATTAAGS